MVAAAKAAKCDAVHPGYGFLSENAAFARACAAAKIAFVGPTPEQLDLFGDKARARAHAQKCKVPVLPGTDGRSTSRARRRSSGSTPRRASRSRRSPAAAAAACGWSPSEGAIAEAFARASAEAKAAFGNGALYVERLVRQARHIEVQIVGDGKGVVALGERECSLQRRSQKIVELAPSPGLQAGAAQEDRRCGARDGEGREVPQPRHLRVPGRGRRLLLHRGQSAAAGRAHRHRGGEGRRPGAGCSCAAQLPQGRAAPHGAARSSCG